MVKSVPDTPVLFGEYSMGRPNVIKITNPTAISNGEKIINPVVLKNRSKIRLAKFRILFCCDSLEQPINIEYAPQ